MTNLILPYSGACDVVYNVLHLFTVNYYIIYKA